MVLKKNTLLNTKTKSNVSACSPRIPRQEGDNLFISAKKNIFNVNLDLIKTAVNKLPH